MFVTSFYYSGFFGSKLAESLRNFHCGCKIVRQLNERCLLDSLSLKKTKEESADLIIFYMVVKNFESFAGTRFDQGGNKEHIDGLFGFVPSN